MKILNTNALVALGLLSAVTAASWSADEECMAAEIDRLVSEDEFGVDHFGWSIDAWSNMLVVGATRDSQVEYAAGAAYLFDTLTGERLVKLVALDGESGDRLGYSVGLSSNTIAAGADSHQDKGAVYTFDLLTYEQRHKLVASDGENFDNFGKALAISERHIVIGAPSRREKGVRMGAAYVFDVLSGQELHRLIPSSLGEQDYFGGALAINSTLAAVSSRNNGDEGVRAGKVFLFDLQTGQQVASVISDDIQQFDRFGTSIDMSESLLVVGSPRARSGNGAVYVFDLATNMQIAKIIPTDFSSYSWFGKTVSIDGDLLVVGADGVWGGSEEPAYAFDLSSGEQLARIIPSDVGVRIDYFAHDVVVSGETIIVSSEANDNDGGYSGAAYLFEYGCWPVCHADFTDDGVLDFNDVSRFLLLFNGQTPRSDFNNDGVWNFFDISAFLTAYRGGCF